MQLPRTTNSLLYWMDPSEKFITKNSSNKVLAVANRTNGELAIPSFGFEPLWVDNAIGGKPVLRFNGAQNLVYNLNVSASSIGTNIPL